MTIDLPTLVDAARLNRVAPGLVTVALGPSSIRIRLTAEQRRVCLVAELATTHADALPPEDLRVESLESPGDQWVGLSDGVLQVGRCLVDPTAAQLHEACHEAAKLLAALVGGAAVVAAARLDADIVTSPVSEASPFDGADPELAQARSAAASRAVTAPAGGPGWTTPDLRVQPDTQLVPGAVYRVLAEDATTAQLLGPDGRAVFARRTDLTTFGPTG